MAPNTEDPELENRIRILYEKADFQNQGCIDKTALIQAYKDAKHPMINSDDHINQLFNTIDNKHDDLIDYNEFKSYFQRAEREIKSAFDMLDKDHTGYLNRGDLKNYLETTLKLHPSQEAFEQFYINLDRDHDGLVAYEEWRDMLLLTPRNQGSRLKTAYKYFNEDLNVTSDGDMTMIYEFFAGFGYFVSGGVSGVISRTCTAPFDRIKVFLIARADLSSTFLNKKSEIANKNHNHPPLDKIKSPLVKAATTLYRQGGLKAFYVGNGLNCLKVFPEAAMKFGTFEIVKKVFCEIEGVSDNNQLSKISTYISGGIAGMVSQFTVYPVDTLKFRVQCAPLQENRSGILLKTARQMYKEGGFRLFYRGLIAGLTGIFPYAAIDLGTFTTIKKVLIRRKALRDGVSEEDVRLSNFTVLPLGAFSGTVGACVVYPINLLRTRLQAQGTYAHPFTYNGIGDVFKQTIQREGFPGLYKGLVPNLAKVIPAVSITYLVFENMKLLLKLD